MEAREVLTKFKQNEITLEEAEHYFRKQPFEEMDYAKLDSHREIRSGFPEVIFCSGKADVHFTQIFKKLYEENGEVFVQAKENEAEPAKETFLDFPEKVYWPQLVKVLEEEGYAADARDADILVSW